LDQKLKEFGNGLFTLIGRKGDIKFHDRETSQNNAGKGAQTESEELQ